MGLDDGIDTIDEEGGKDTDDYSSITTDNGIKVTLDEENQVTVFIDKDGDTTFGDDDTYDLIKNVENVTGGAGSDTIIGDDQKNILSGNGGDDYINGDAGDDTIYGGTGNDVLLGDAGDDTIYGDAGNDVISGGTGDDTLYGGAGDDTLSGGTGLDLIDGGEDDEVFGDSIDYSGENLELTINLKNIGESIATYATARVGGQVADYLKNIENIKGTIYGDIIGGDDDKNTLEGHYGDDSIIGSGRR
jgi:Ca2+-binding RTX toxin-like protein